MSAAGERYGYDGAMRIITVNVCGVRSAASKGLFRWLGKLKADAIFFFLASYLTL